MAPVPSQADHASGLFQKLSLDGSNQAVETSGAFADNGALMYPLGYGYAPYTPYSPATSPVPTLGQEGQMYGAQHYQYPNPYFQSLTPTSGSFSNQSQGADARNSKQGGSANGRTGYQNSAFNGNGRGATPASYYQDPRFGYDGLQSWYENPYLTSGHSTPLTSFPATSTGTGGNSVYSSRNQNYQPHLMGTQYSRPGNAASGYMNGMYSNKLYGQYENSYRSGRMDYGSTYYGSRMNARGLYNESVDGLNELNRGPRGKITQNPTKESVPVALAVKGQNSIPINVTSNEFNSVTPDREQYNRSDLPETYTDAKFFVIKSYSEDDVHKSIKYNVWSSTPNGNNKLNTAYSEAQQKSGGCPVFLFFSVNTSGQFVGVAEMIGPVDFNKNIEYWQQDKWVGFFPVKWHIVKDVPNSMLKHIILEYNENKPVTNSRDTQEVKLDQGIELLKIFKDHTSVQCILDDFEFYEDRQKRIKEKKAKQQQFLKLATQVREEKNENMKEGANSEFKPQNSLKVTSNLDKATEAIPVKIANGC